MQPTMQTMRRRMPQGGTAGPIPSDMQPQVQYVEDFFIYEVDTPTAGLAAGATFNGSFIVQADSDFKWTKATFFADIAQAALTDSTRVIPLAAVQIIDTGSGRNLFSGSVPIPSLFGTGQLPFILPVPRIFKARANISVIMTNFSAATTYNLKLSFIGSKIFALG